MFCTHCGNEEKEGTKFCTRCGAVLDSETNKEQENYSFKENVWVKKTKQLFSGKMVLGIFIGAIVVALVFYVVSNQKEPTTYVNDNQAVGVNDNQVVRKQLPDISSVVNIFCPTGDQEFSLEAEGFGGSGTIITEDGFVITNSHVIPQDDEYLDTIEEGCFIVIPEAETGQPDEIYLANPVVIAGPSDDYDLAWLEIYDVYTDPEDGYVYGKYPRKFPVYDDDGLCMEEFIQLGEPVKIYGYPVGTGGFSLTVTDGVVSSFLEDGLITVSAKVDEGNSGGLAVDRNGCMIGIPTMVGEGTYENMGIVIPASLIEEFFIEVTELDEESNY
ncbi:trypsin-like peptidase domain-containing protein [Patescibacteria group bacterium]|nr:trypsin-like peptidase domain-containing protein [Patescibacteria group bacterium]MCG2688760.1 trypsin-like peptidase domain-containing protein [Candidatus Parcubacteria bacterium]